MEGHNKYGDYDVSKYIINMIRSHGEEKRHLNEAEEKNDGESIAITNDPRFGQNVLQNQIDSFKQTVHNGAKFAESNPKNPNSSPLVYFPETGNLVFSGSIPVLSGLKFQFSLNDVTNAPYIFVDGLALTEDVITTLNKMCGYYKNWKDSWLESSDLLEKLKKDRVD